MTVHEWSGDQFPYSPPFIDDVARFQAFLTARPIESWATFASASPEIDEAIEQLNLAHPLVGKICEASASEQVTELIDISTGSRFKLQGSFVGHFSGFYPVVHHVHDTEGDQDIVLSLGARFMPVFTPPWMKPGEVLIETPAEAVWSVTPDISVRHPFIDEAKAFEKVIEDVKGLPEAVRRRTLDQYTDRRSASTWLAGRNIRVLLRDNAMLTFEPHLHPTRQTPDMISEAARTLCGRVIGGTILGFRSQPTGESNELIVYLKGADIPQSVPVFGRTGVRAADILQASCLPPSDVETYNEHFAKEVRMFQRLLDKKDYQAIESGEERERVMAMWVEFINAYTPLRGAHVTVLTHEATPVTIYDQEDSTTLRLPVGVTITGRLETLCIGSMNDVETLCIYMEPDQQILPGKTISRLLMPVRTVHTKVHSRPQDS